MKLYFSPSSPYARKCAVVVAELGLSARVEHVAGFVSPVAPSPEVSGANPLGKIPTLIADDGTALFDSRVICEYLSGLVGDQKIFPAAGSLRWRALTDQALGDGLLDAALLARYERFLRPADKQWDDWEAGQQSKIAGTLKVIDAAAGGYGDRVDIGTIAIGCGLGYLDFRFGHLNWRDRHPNAAGWFARFDQLPSMAASAPIDPNAKR